MKEPIYQCNYISIYIIGILFFYKGGEEMTLYIILRGKYNVKRLTKGKNLIAEGDLLSLSASGGSP